MDTPGISDAVRKKLSSAVTFAVVVASVFFVLYLPLGRHIGAFLFNDRKAGTFVSNCSVMLFAIVLAQVTTPMLNSIGKEKTTFIHSLIGAAVMLPCTLLLPKYVGVYSMAIGSGACFLTIAILNVVALTKKVGSFLDFKKTMTLIAFSIPLAVLGMLADRLLSSVAGDLATTLTLGVLLTFFMFVLLNAFEIANVQTVIKLFKSGGTPRRARVLKGHKT